MKINCIYGRNYDSNIYLITGNTATLIDCGTGFHHDKVKEDIEDIIDFSEIDQIVLTHEHFDHCGDLKKISEETAENTKIMTHEKAAGKIERGESSFARLLGGNMPQMPVDITVEEGEKIEIGEEEFEVLYTPGHTEGSICLYNKENKTLFSGDTIFAHGSFGRTDLPGGNSKLLHSSIEKVSKLEVNNLYPGHEQYVEGNAAEHIRLSLKNSRRLI